jgi:DNA-binding LacI/PurR family transcriptional regulator/signal transduction histidine kinase
MVTLTMGEAKSLLGRPPRIGIFIGFIDDSYQHAIWCSLTARARDRGAQAIGFLGHGLGAPLPSLSTMNVAYRLAGPRSVDALVVISSTVGNFTGPAGIARLIAERGLPAVSIGFPLDGVPSVRAQGRTAMIELVLHLVRAHGKRRLALVTGPERHIDSMEREAAFRETLAAEGLDFTEELLYRGQFFKESGSEAVASFLASGSEFDAVVCLNDFMALGAMEELRKRGVAVPSRVAVTGFDDVMEARWAPSPLTTVCQPLERVGGAAMDMALELLDGRLPPSQTIDCRCVFRESCGCPPTLPLSAPELAIRAMGEDPSRVARIEEAARAGDAEAMLRSLDSALSGGSGEASDASSVEGLRSLLYRAKAGRGAVPPDRGGGYVPIDCYDQAFAFLDRVELGREVRRTISASVRHSYLRELGTRLLADFSVDALVRNWEECVGSMGFGRGYLVLFVPPVEKGGGKAPARSALLASAPAPGSGVARREFPSEFLLPPGLGRSWGGAGWLLEPLVYQDEPLGYILVESGTEDPKAYETLRMEMSTAVKAALLMEEIRRSERDLERLVGMRTKELREANRDLKSQIEQRRILELEVQDISDRTLQSIGQDIHDDLCQHLAGVSMLAAVAEETLVETGSVSVESIREIRGLLESAVARSRQFARTLYPPGLEELGLVQALDDLVESLGRSAAGVSLSFRREGDCRIEDPAKALQLYRVVQEALSNALRHSGSEVVMLRLFRRDGLLVAEVRDFGRGFLPDSMGRGMGLRIMRFRAESMGARLEISSLDPGICVSCALDP